ncbi:Alg9-like mannosyltransferase family-domain-containing protein [Lipomyces oligophaga]|uniref:Alg9-like mannosyltransferase family-domain-containing protein n=1 Tax=Lipomyces oligophaga TaxID=45792 RepID=UPI0034CE4A23
MSEVKITEEIRRNEHAGLSGLLLPIALTVRILCAQFSIIPDCDEVFNYWEPTHFLTRGFGLETWEYSPVYAIRSWFYVWIHALILKGCLKCGIPQENLFFALRAVLGTFCAYCEVHLFYSIKARISSRAAQLFAVFSLSAPGMFHASVTFLPSSFSMYWTMLSFSTMIRTDMTVSAKTISFFAVSAIVGWTFAAAVAIPYFVTILWQVLHESRPKSLSNLGKAVTLSAALLTAVMVVDSKAFGKLQCVPMNIVLYNVFGTEHTGPNIFGTEPWIYYVHNLLLNFHFIAVFAAFSSIILMMLLFSNHQDTPTNLLVNLLLPLFFWSGIFFLQPHKEERFFYIVYPLISLNGSIFVDFSLSIFSTWARKSGFSSRLVFIWISCFFIFTTSMIIFIGLVRILALHSFYFAPIMTYSALLQQSTASPISNVCVGREWYRYPSSFFLQDNMRLKFIQSDFDGLLPTEFEGKPWTKAASRIPVGLNNVNKEEVSFYFPVDNCDYIIDSNFTSSTSQGTFEQQYILDEQHWSLVTCFPFIDSDRTSVLARIVKLPQWIEDLIPDTPLFRREWTSYCLLKRREVIVNTD